jgi:hypothetical protein
VYVFSSQTSLAHLKSDIRSADDTPDAEIVYAMSLVFTPPSSPPPTRHTTRIDTARERAVGPTHGFLDDEVFVSLGLRDNEMGTVRMEARDMLYGMTVC